MHCICVCLLWFVQKWIIRLFLPHWTNVFKYRRTLERLYTYFLQYWRSLTTTTEAKKRGLLLLNNAFMRFGKQFVSNNRGRRVRTHSLSSSNYRSIIIFVFLSYFNIFICSRYVATLKHNNPNALKYETQQNFLQSDKTLASQQERREKTQCIDLLWSRAKLMTT